MFSHKVIIHLWILSNIFVTLSWQIMEKTLKKKTPIKVFSLKCSLYRFPWFLLLWSNYVIWISQPFFRQLVVLFLLDLKGNKNEHWHLFVFLFWRCSKPLSISDVICICLSHSPHFGKFVTSFCLKSRKNHRNRHQNVQKL